MEIKIKNLSDTKKVAKKLGSLLKGDEIICLYGDLGAGKTTFTRFLLESIGVKENVLSPTFVLRSDYNSQKGTIYHFDWYRLETPDELYGVEFFDVLKNGIVIIEWADRFENIL